MPREPKRVYWDSCVFLSFMDGPDDRLPDIDALFAATQRTPPTLVIYTSQLSIAEVAFAQKEKIARALNPDIAKKIDAFWSDESAITLIDVHEFIVREAQSLVRRSMRDGVSCKPYDAIHLATAMRMKVTELHSYDDRLRDCARHFGLSATRPQADQLLLLESSP